MLATLSRRAVRVSTPANVRIAELATTMQRDGTDIIDLSAGRPAESTPHYICEAAAAALISGGTHQTMTQGSVEFRNACAQKLASQNGVIADPDRSIVATLGGKQGLLLALIAAVNHGDEVIIEDPCYLSYDPAIRFAGGQPIRVPLLREMGFRWTRESLESAVTRYTRAIVISSPHNPTGRVNTSRDLDILAEVAQEHDLLVIADETYESLVWNEQPHRSLSTWPGMEDRTVTLMSLNKSFSMGGWRIGFNHGPEPLIKGMVRVQQHLVSSSSSFAQAGAAVALGKAFGRRRRLTHRARLGPIAALERVASFNSLHKETSLWRHASSTSTEPDSRSRASPVASSPRGICSRAPRRAR